MNSSKSLELSESEVWFAERQPTGFIVALWLSPEIAEKLALASGEAAEQLHITLAYCGDASELGELGQARAITAIDELVRYRDRLEGKIAGYGRFIASESSDGQDVFYVTPDVPQLVELRQAIVNCLLDRGVPVSTAHGFSPHITLAYLDSGSANPVEEVEATPLTFDGVTIMSGTRRIDIPFWTPEPELTISMSASGELPLSTLLGVSPARALYFGSFDKEWIPFLPKPGTYTHEVYGEMDLTSDVYDQMLDNFNKYVYKQDLPIRATHTPQDSGAIGWIKPGGMRLAGDGSLEVKPEWNELGKGLVDDDRFRYASAEFCRIWTNPVTQQKTQNVAVGLALVTRPHFKTDVLAPLSAAEALAFAEATPPPLTDDTKDIVGGNVDSQPNSTEIGKAEKGTQMADEPVVVTTPEVVTPPVVTSPVAEPPVLPAISLNDLTQVVITAEQRTTERQMFSDLTARAELAERRAVTSEAELKRISTERRTEKFTAEVIGRSAENGQPWFGNPKDNVAHLVSLAETYGDESPEVRWAVTQKRNEAQAIRATGIFDPISLGAPEDGASVTAQVAHLAEQFRLADKDLTMDQAITRAYDENPELYIKSLKK